MIYLLWKGYGNFLAHGLQYVTHFKIVVFCKEASMSFIKWGLVTSLKILCFNVRIKYRTVPIVCTNCCPLRHRLISYMYHFTYIIHCCRESRNEPTKILMKLSATFIPDSPILNSSIFISERMDISTLDPLALASINYSLTSVNLDLINTT